jgi:very-short-patch-repair endonuclease
VEVDGSQHMHAGSGDAERTAFLRTRGYRVLRFWNNEVLAETESVLEKIRLVLLEPPPYPPPRAGEGKREPRKRED